MIPNRKVWVENDSYNMGEWKITHTAIDISSGNTVITVDGTLHESGASNAVLKIYGYETGAGFDGLNECSQPKPFNIHAAFSEHVTIFIDDIPANSTPEPEPERDWVPVNMEWGGHLHTHK